MKMIPVYCFILCLAAGGSHSLAPSHPRYPALIQCRDKERSLWTQQGGAAVDYSMTRCYKQLVLAAMDTLKQGKPVPALGVESLEPLTVPLMKLDIEELSMHGNITNASFHGLTKGFHEATEFQMSASNKRGQISAKLTELTAEGDFDISMNFLKTMFPGTNVGDGLSITGKIGGRWDKMEVTIYVVLGDTTNRQGTRFIVAKKVGVKQVNEGMALSFSPSFTGNESGAERDRQNALFSLLNTVANNEQLQKAMLRKFEPALTGIVAQNFFGLLTKGFDKIDAI